MSGTVQEPLRDMVGRAIYEESDDLDWYSLSEERREPWRKDADRAIRVMGQFRETESATTSASSAQNLITALAGLRNEVVGALELSGVRKALGNTNTACLERRVKDAEWAIEVVRRFHAEKSVNTTDI